MTDTYVVMRRKRLHHNFGLVLTFYLGLLHLNDVEVLINGKAVELPLPSAVRQPSDVESSYADRTF